MQNALYALLFALTALLSPALTRADEGRFSDVQGVGDLPNTYPQIEVFEPEGWVAQRESARRYILKGPSGSSVRLSYVDLNIKTALAVTMEAFVMRKKEAGMTCVTKKHSDPDGAVRSADIRCTHVSDPPSRYDELVLLHCRILEDGQMLLMLGTSMGVRDAHETFTSTFEKTAARSHYRPTPKSPKLASTTPSIVTEKRDPTQPLVKPFVPNGWLATKQGPHAYLLTAPFDWKIKIQYAPSQAPIKGLAIEMIKHSVPSKERQCRITTQRARSDLKTGDEVVEVSIDPKAKLPPACDYFSSMEVKRLHLRSRDEWTISILGSIMAGKRTANKTFLDDFAEVVEKSEFAPPSAVR